MNARRLRWPALGVLLGALALVLVFGLRPPATDAPSHAEGAADVTGSAWERLDADEPAPAFTLTDQHGRRVALADLRGKVAIVTFLFTQCTDVCPVLPQILARVDQHLSEAERARVVYVGISIDAQRDTPARLREFIAERGLDAARWTLLTGSAAELTQAAGDYGIVVRPDPRLDFVHNTVFVLVDPAGRLRTEFHGLATPAPEIARAARTLLATGS
jgi:protein SCO1/2